jgi:cysteine synthase A
MPGAIRKCNELHEADPNSVIASQFDNPANPSIHESTTAEEIWRDTGGKVDADHLRRRHRRHHLRRRDRHQEAQSQFQSHRRRTGHSPVITQCKGRAPQARPAQDSRRRRRLHPQEPRNANSIDEVITCTNEDAFAFARRLAAEEGILAGISSGANMWAALQVALRPEYKGKTIVTVMCSTGERYISTAMYDGLGE